MINWPNTEERENTQDVKTGRIIVVDDHAVFRQALAVLLEQQAGFDVYAEAAFLPEARSILRNLSGKLDLAVVDLDLPDGEELIRELNEGGSGTSVLGLTSGRERAVGAWGAVLSTEASVDEILAAARRLVR